MDATREKMEATAEKMVTLDGKFHSVAEVLRLMDGNDAFGLAREGIGNIFFIAEMDP